MQRGVTESSAFTFAGGDACCLCLPPFILSVSSSLSLAQLMLESTEGAGRVGRSRCFSSFLPADKVPFSATPTSSSSSFIPFSSFSSSFASTVSPSFSSTSSSPFKSSSSSSSPWWYCCKRTCHARLQTDDTVLNWWTTLRGMK